MAFAIITTTNSRRDIQHAIDWENSRQEELGERFLEYLNLKFSSISITPFMGSIRYDNVRCTPTNVFQYLIHYTVDPTPERVIVLRVLHMRMQPIW